jgi:catechol 2,3-dioxygenase-like lactoylglutathione lyase family enzyme
MRLHHVQVACPPGGEDDARRFYVAGLGMVEVDKPAELAGRGGCWFRAQAGEVTTAEIHVGVEQRFAPARKAHPAFVLDSVAELEQRAADLHAAGFEVDSTERSTFAGFERFHTADGSGNRVEVMAPATAG